MSKPEIVLIPGAWHSIEHYQLFINKLVQHGYGTTSGALPSTWTHVDPKEQTMNSDAEHIRNTFLTPEIEKGKDVVIIMHSYAGFPGSVAAKGLSKAERLAAGKKGGVIGLIFMAAFVGHEGESLQSSLPGNKLAPWTIVEEGTGQVDVDQPQEIFYAGTDANLAKKAINGLAKQSHKSFTSPSGPPAWKDEVFNGRRAYVKCTQDAAIVYEGQNAMLANSGVEWKVLEIDADHSPQLNHVDELCKFVDELTAEWTK